MAETTTAPAQSANDVLAADTTAPTPIASPGAGGLATHDASGLPLDYDAIEAAYASLGQPAAETDPSSAPESKADAETPTPETPAGETTPQATTEQDDPAAVVTTTTEEPESTPATEGAAPATEKILPSRIGTGQFSEQTQRAMRLMHELNGGKPEGEGSHTLSECIAMIAAADQKSDGTQQAAQADPEPTQADVLRGEVEALEATIRTAGEDQSIFGPELAQAMIDLADKKAALAAISAVQTATQQTSVAQHTAARAAVKQQVVSEFKGAEDPKTPLGARVATLIEELKNPNHPQHRQLYDVNAPRFVVETAANEVAKNIADTYGLPVEQVLNSLRTQPAAATPPPAQVQAKAPAAPAAPLPVAGNKPVTVASGSNGTGGAATPPTEQQILAAAAANPDSIDSLLGYGNSFQIG